MMSQNKGSDSVLPYSLEAEKSVLGSIIIDPSCISIVLEYLSVESFYSEQNKKVFSVMMTMFTSGETIDIVTLLNRIEQEKIFKDSDNAKVYLAGLAEIVPTSAHVESYAKIVREKQYVRDLSNVAKEIVRESSQGDMEAENLLDMAEQRIFDIRQGKSARGLTPISSVLVNTYDHLQRISGEDREDYLGISSGFSALDQVTTGLNKSDFILVAGRPGMGKTSFALNIAENVAAKGKKSVAIFSLEMSAEQLVARLLSSKARIPSHKFRTGNMTTEEWGRIATNTEILSKYNMYIDDTTSITVAEMKAKLRRMDNLGLVVIDYLQLMTTGGRTESRVQEVSEMTRGIKLMAKELNVPVITCSQLSRGPDSRQDRRPMLSDLRESGSIEQDADIVMFLYREGYYDPDTEDDSIAECIVAKNRHGETTTVKLQWNGSQTRFSNLEEHLHEE